MEPRGSTLLKQDDPKHTSKQVQCECVTSVRVKFLHPCERLTEGCQGWRVVSLLHFLYTAGLESFLSFNKRNHREELHLVITGIILSNLNIWWPETHKRDRYAKNQNPQISGRRQILCAVSSTFHFILPSHHHHWVSTYNCQIFHR